MAFEHVGLEWEKFVEVDKKYVRPLEVEALIGDSSKAASELNWRPKTYWEDVAKLMVDHDLNVESI